MPRKAPKKRGSSTLTTTKNPKQPGDRPRRATRSGAGATTARRRQSTTGTMKAPSALAVASAGAVRRLRLRRSCLIEPAADAAGAARALIGVQGQVLHWTAVALWNRVAAPFTEADVDDALYKRPPALMRCWSYRCTLHCFAPEDFALGVRAVNDPSAESEGERTAVKWNCTAQDVRDGAALAEKWLLDTEGGDDEGESSQSPQIGVDSGEEDLRLLRPRDLEALGVPAELGRRCVFGHLTAQGKVCYAGVPGAPTPSGLASRGSMFAHRQVWAPHAPWSPLPFQDAVDQLFLRYLAGYGPATARDFAFFRGFTVGPALKAAETLLEAGKVVPIQCESLDGSGGQVELLSLPEDAEALSTGDRGGAEGLPWVLRMLGCYDPTVLAFKDKTWLVPAEHYKEVWLSAARVKGVVVVADGASARSGVCAVASWDVTRVYKPASRRRLDVQVKMFAGETLKKHQRVALSEAVSDLAEFFALPLGDVDIDEGSRVAPATGAGGGAAGKPTAKTRATPAASGKGGASKRRRVSAA